MAELWSPYVLLPSGVSAAKLVSPCTKIMEVASSLFYHVDKIKMGEGQIVIETIPNVSVHKQQS